MSQTQDWAHAAQPQTKTTRLLPPSPDADRPLFVVIAIIVALAAAAAIAARATWRASSSWTGELQGAMTIQVTPDRGMDLEGATNLAVKVARSLPEVADASPLSRAEVEALLAPWFGSEGLPTDAPTPGLVDVRVKSGAPSPAQALRRELVAAGLNASVDDHAAWADDLRRAAWAMRGVAAAVLGLLAAAAGFVTVYATRASLAARADVVELLHLIGARDGYIAGLFTRRFASLGLKSGAVGAGAALLGAFAVQMLTEGGGTGMLPDMSLSIADVVVAGLAAPVGGLVAALTAREAVMRTLARHP